MSKNYLLIDFGASRVKTAILSNNQLISIKEFLAVKPEINNNNYFEVSAQKLKEFFIDIAKKQYEEKQYDAILISSEMHGFILTDKNNQPLTNYISWKDERCLNKNNIEEYHKLSNKFKTSFLNKTGLELKPYCPITKIDAVANNTKLKEFKIISLPEWFSCCSDLSLNVTNVTMSAGLGFYNINDNCWDKELIDYFQEYDVKFNKTINNIDISGYFKYNNLNIPIYTGVGDFQAAILGAGYGENIINLNLGTGSQVSTILKSNTSSQIRPFFNNKNLSVITHIPSGRALNVYMNFLKEINPNINFWEQIDNLKLDDVINSTLNINLGVFSSAWNFSGSGKIDNIFENNFTLKNFIASLLRSYLEQYELAIKKLSSDNNFKKIIISGGIASNISLIKDYFKYKYPSIEVTIFKSIHDTTILGLQKIAKFLDGENDV